MKYQIRYCFQLLLRFFYGIHFEMQRNPLDAVKSYGLSLEYVKDQTPEICLAAVQQNGWALQYVKKQTPEICLAAVRKEPEVLKLVKKTNT